MRPEPTRPLVSCSPWAAVLLLLGAAAWLGWRFATPAFRAVHDAQAEPRPVVARGDLAADEQATIEIFRTAAPSVVHITTLERRYARDRIRLRALDFPLGTGSGFVWDARGYVVTNAHVLAGASRAVVTLDDRSEHEAYLVGADVDFDLAVLKIEAPGRELPAVAIGTSSGLLVGQKVFAIGNPFGLDHTLTTGIISGLEREISDSTGRPIRGLIQTDAAINPGNSGGPLLDSAGRLIGVNTAIYSTSGSSAGIGFAVPIDTVNRVVPSLLRRGQYVPPRMGVTLAPDSVARELGVRGLVVETVSPGSGAAEAGLRSLELGDTGVRADVITAIEGRPVEHFFDVQEILGDYRPGDTVEVELLRDGRTTTVRVVLQEGI